MNELKDRILDTINVFLTNLDTNVAKGNKAAGIRARKASLELEKLFKEYRKLSVKA